MKIVPIKNENIPDLKNKYFGAWYHWSPTERRNQIIRYGLMPGQWSTDKLWKPPCVCLASTPNLAWVLSGRTSRGSQIDSWDLWEVFVGDQSGYEELYFDSGVVKEIRVYERIYKRNVWFVGERTNL